MRTTSLLMSVALVASLFAGVIASTADTYAKKSNHKVAICHATSSTKNPYVKISVDYHSIIKQGHDQHQDGRDIIPALPQHDYAGQNLHLASTLENDCQTPNNTETDQPEQPNKPDQPTKPEQPNKPSKKQHKYTICHATRSATNPYRAITVDYNSIIKQGHGSHDDLAVASYTEARDVKKAGGHWGDVIPSIPEHNYLGKNNDETGRKLLANNCKVKVDRPDKSEETPVDNVEDQPKTPGQGGIKDQDDNKVEAETEPVVEQTVDTLPLTGIVTSPLMILLIGLLTAGASYLVSSFRHSATE